MTAAERIASVVGDVRIVLRTPSCIASGVVFLCVMQMRFWWKAP